MEVMKKELQGLDELDKFLKVEKKMKEKNRALKLFFKDEVKLSENDHRTVANAKSKIAKQYNWDK